MEGLKIFLKNDKLREAIVNYQFSQYASASGDIVIYYMS